jgi:hypothetical protein
MVTTLGFLIVAYWFAPIFSTLGQLATDGPKQKTPTAAPFEVILVIGEDRANAKKPTGVLVFSWEGYRDWRDHNVLDDEILKERLRNPGILELYPKGFRASASYPENKRDCVLQVLIDSTKLAGKSKVSVAKLVESLRKLEEFRDKTRPTYIFVYVIDE